MEGIKKQKLKMTHKKTSFRLNSLYFQLKNMPLGKAG